MLQKRIDLGSIPFGLAVAGEDIQKGSAVVVKYTGNGANGMEAFLPKTESEANDIKGFATFRVETKEGSDREHDMIKAGDWLVIYTLVKDNMWGTTEFVSGAYSNGDELVVGYTVGTDAGKLRAKSTAEVTAERKVQFVVSDVNNADSTYLDEMLDVEVK